jgi:glc operon protein GlcG
MASGLTEKKSLTLGVAKQIASAAEAEAIKNKLAMVIAIVDDGGHLVYLERMDETQFGSVLVAQAKAHAAASFKRSTKILEDAVAGGRIALMSLPGICAIEGGLPLIVEGKMIGAIGASGGTGAQDGVVAQAGVDALEKLAG